MSQFGERSHATSEFVYVPTLCLGSRRWATVMTVLDLSNRNEVVRTAFLCSRSLSKTSSQGALATSPK